MGYLTKHLWLLIALLFQNLLWVIVGILIGAYLFGRHSPKNKF